MRNGVCSPQPPLAPPTVVSASGFWPGPTAADGHKQSGTGQPTSKHNTTLTDRAVRLWGTPTATQDGKNPETAKASKEAFGRSEVTALKTQSKMWETPKSRDCRSPAGEGAGSRKSPDLNVQGSTWPTPAASAGARGSDPVRTNDRAGGMTLRQAAERAWPTPLMANGNQRSPNDLSEFSPTLVDEAGRLAQTTATDGASGSPEADLNPRFVESLMGLPEGWCDPEASLTSSTYSAMGSFRSWLRRHLPRWRLELELPEPSPTDLQDRVAPRAQ
jgi:hypothetical protein